MHPETPQRYETQVASGLSLVHYPELRKGVGVWGFKGKEGNHRKDRRKVYRQRLSCRADVFQMKKLCLVIALFWVVPHPAPF